LILVNQPYIDDWSWRQSDVAAIARNFFEQGAARCPTARLSRAVGASRDLFYFISRGVAQGLN